MVSHKASFFCSLIPLEFNCLLRIYETDTVGHKILIPILFCLLNLNIFNQNISLLNHKLLTECLFVNLLFFAKAALLSIILKICFSNSYIGVESQLTLCKWLD